MGVFLQQVVERCNGFALINCKGNDSFCQRYYHERQ